jgi:hypothetical protein
MKKRCYFKDVAGGYIHQEKEFGDYHEIFFIKKSSYLNIFSSEYRFEIER